MIAALPCSHEMTFWSPPTSSSKRSFISKVKAPVRSQSPTGPRFIFDPAPK